MRFFYFLTLVSSFFFLISSSFKPKPSAKSALKVLNGFANFIPNGSVIVDQDTSTVQSFYMSSTEVSNLQYLEFLSFLKRTGQSEKYQIAKIDSSLWERSFINAYLTPMADHYHNHPAYNNYPVVNISKEAANMYCDWLTDVYDSLSGGELSLKFRLPTREEWLRAARGEDIDAPYAWGGPFLRNSKGCFLANFVQIGSGNITRDQETGEFKVIIDSQLNYDADIAFVTAPVESYFPNAFGLYNMNGNVSEMIADQDIVVGGDWSSPGYDIRNESFKTYTGPHPTVGFRVVATYLQPK
jgi:sulfatase modifying factor 1